VRKLAAEARSRAHGLIRQHHYHVRLRRVQSKRRELAAELICQCLARERDERADRILAAEAADLVDSGRSPVICLGNHCQSKGTFAERRRSSHASALRMSPRRCPTIGRSASRSPEERSVWIARGDQEY
jgi:hypothetical protein